MDKLNKLDKELKELRENMWHTESLAARAHTAAKQAEKKHRDKVREIRKVETQLGLVDKRRALRSSGKII